MLATTIDEAVSILETIVQTSRRKNSALGYFPAMYKRVTEAVGDAVKNKLFTDNKRMETFDVLFANRYLAAFDRYNTDKNATHCWQVAFNATNSWQPTVVQHLALGMNAHINLDLGIAAAHTARLHGQSIEQLHGDFNKINDVLSSLVDSFIKDLAAICPPFKLLNRISWDDRLISLGINEARDVAWEFAKKIANTNSSAKEEYLIRDADELIALVGKGIVNPILPIRTAWLSIRVWEIANKQRIMAILDRPFSFPATKEPAPKATVQRADVEPTI